MIRSPRPGRWRAAPNLIAFTTGRGSVFGSKPAPSLKIATTTDLYRRMKGDMDFDGGRVLSEGADVAALGAELFELIVATAAGRETCSETLGIGEDEIQPWRLGATM